MQKLFLLDGHALVYRAHYAFIARPLLNSKGWNVSAVQGFTRTLIDLLNNQKPTHLAVAFDPHGPTFRHEQFTEYKANRDAQPEDISFAIPWIIKILEAMKIPILTIPGYEADDVIGTLAKQAEKEGFDVYMVTPDKDYGQLVSEHIKMYKPGRQGNEVEIWGEKEVCENWGIARVEQVVDMIGLMGDSVDNISGLPGIGPKSAAKLLEEFGSVENILANTDKLKGKQAEIVKEHHEKATLSKWLARIDIEVPIQFDATTFEMEMFDTDTIIDLFKELEFRSLATTVLQSKYGGGKKGDDSFASSGASKAEKKSLGPTVVQNSLFGEDPDAARTEPLRLGELNIKNTPHEYHLVQSEGEFAILLEKLNAAEAYCFDTETTSLDTHAAELVGLSFSVKPYEAFYVPVPEKRAEANAIMARFKPLIEHPTKMKIGQNIKYDASVLLNYDIKVSLPFFDTMIAHYLLEPELRHGMDYLAETLLNYSPVKIEELIGPKGKGQGSMRDVPLEKITEYAAEDADITLRLKEFLEPKIKEQNLEKLFHEVEAPLINVLTAIEREGVRIDTKFLNDYSKVLGAQITELEDKILKESGQQFNVASPKQVGEILFDVLKLPYPGKKLKSGQYSTDEDMLSGLAKNFPICEDILDHRTLSKLKGTYVDALPLLVNKKTGRIHSSFNQALASTGRLSSNNPNLQNIPIKTKAGRKVREAFIPRDENYVLLSADYSQIELRLIAEISNDEAMLAAFQAGHDIHTATAAGVYGVTIEQVTSEQRRNAKTVNFSIIYGAGALNLSNQLGIKRTEAKELIDGYFKQFSGLRNYMDSTVEFARKHGYVETLMGRKRYLRDIDSRNGLARSNAERVAINTPIQGSAADMIKVAMINIQNDLEKMKCRSKMILQVHDELVFDIHQEELELLRPLIIDRMRTALPNLRVPILVEAGVGKNWLEAH